MVASAERRLSVGHVALYVNDGTEMPALEQKEAMIMDVAQISVVWEGQREARHLCRGSD